MPYYIGVISGTSMDAVDTAIVDFTQGAHLLCYQEHPIDPSLKKKLKQFNQESTVATLVALDYQCGHLFADAIKNTIQKSAIKHSDIIAIGSHGQTVLHQPQSAFPTSLQIGDPNIICARTNIDTVADFRRMDIANGGQGAPLTSAFHQYQFQRQENNIGILNIGGMSNLTVLSKGSKSIGFDIGPGNVLLDDWISDNRGLSYDADGNWAASGKVDEALLQSMLSDSFFSTPPPKSTGRDYFNLNWLQAHPHKTLRPEDVQATLLALTAKTIINAVRKWGDTLNKIMICGGGTYNVALVQMLRKIGSERRWETDYGLKPESIEAISFAWLAKKRVSNETIDLSGITGANKASLIGGLYSAKA